MPFVKASTNALLYDYAWLGNSLSWLHLMLSPYTKI